MTYQSSRAMSATFKRNMAQLKDKDRSTFLNYQSLLYNTDSFGNLQKRHIDRLVEDGRTDLLQEQGVRGFMQRSYSAVCGMFGKQTIYQTIDQAVTAAAGVTDTNKRREKLSRARALDGRAGLEATTTAYLASYVSQDAEQLVQDFGYTTKRMAQPQVYVTNGKPVDSHQLQPITQPGYRLSDLIADTAKGLSATLVNAGNYVGSGIRAASSGLAACYTAFTDGLSSLFSVPQYRTSSVRMALGATALLFAASATLDVGAKILGAETAGISQIVQQQVTVETPESFAMTTVGDEVSYSGTIVSVSPPVSWGNIIDNSSASRPNASPTLKIQGDGEKATQWTHTLDSRNILDIPSDSELGIRMAKRWQEDGVLVAISFEGTGVARVWLNANPEAGIVPGLPVTNDPTARAALMLYEDGIYKGSLDYNYEQWDTWQGRTEPVSIFDVVAQFPDIPNATLKAQSGRAARGFGIDPCAPAYSVEQPLPKGWKTPEGCPTSSDLIM
jgi:hypothetical protein